MSFMLAILVYLAAIGIPVWLLYRYGSQSWYWHCAAIAVSIGLGLLPPSGRFQGPVFDLMFGATFIFLVIWGAGGIVFLNSRAHHNGHHATHA